MARTGSSRRVARTGRTIIISHRRGNASDGDTGASFAGFVASVFGGKADLRVAIVKGVVQAAVSKVSRNWELFDYPPGPFGLGSGGYGWNGPALLPVPFQALVGTEFFDSYTVGPAPELAGGTGWSASALFPALYVARVSVEQFETYPDGAVIGPDLDAGSGWAGAPRIAAY